MKKSIILNLCIFIVPLSLLWGCFFFCCFLTDYDTDNYNYLFNNFAGAYRSTLANLSYSMGNVLAISLFLSYISVLLLTGLMFLSFYILYRDDITLLRLNHFSFLKSNGILCLLVLGCAGLFEVIGFALGYLAIRFYDLIILGLPMTVHCFSVSKIIFIIISALSDVLMALSAFVCPFYGKGFLKQIRRIQR